MTGDAWGCGHLHRCLTAYKLPFLAPRASGGHFRPLASQPCWLQALGLGRGRRAIEGCQGATQGDCQILSTAREAGSASGAAQASHFKGHFFFAQSQGALGR